MPVVRQSSVFFPRSASPAVRRPVFREVPVVSHARPPAVPGESALEVTDADKGPHWKSYVDDRLRHFADY